MARRPRRNHSPDFKVALAALKDEKTLAELSQQFDIHPNVYFGQLSIPYAA